MDIREGIKCFTLFSGVDHTIVDKYISRISPKISSYKRGDCIYSPDKFESEVGIVLSGECDIIQGCKNESGVELKKLRPGDTFGLLAVLLNEDSYPTYIHAKRATEIAFISKPDFDLMLEIPEVSRNLISFLAERIVFLNKKIATISASGVENKLSHYLLMQYNKFGDTIVGFNKQNVAKTIGAGRASLYRAISSLISKGAISLDKNTLKIINIDILKG